MTWFFSKEQIESVPNGHPDRNLRILDVYLICRLLAPVITIRSVFKNTRSPERRGIVYRQTKGVHSLRMTAADSFIFNGLAESMCNWHLCGVSPIKALDYKKIIAV